MSYDTTTETDGMKLDEMLQPDVVLPAQFHVRARALRDSERRLRVAVLEGAIRHLERYLDATDRRGRAFYEDAVDWFGSPDRFEPFAFENVCDALELDADSIRQGLCRWRAAERERRARACEPPPRVGGAAGSRKTRTIGSRHLRAA